MKKRYAITEKDNDWRSSKTHADPHVFECETQSLSQTKAESVGAFQP